MCDYSLMGIPNRLACEGEDLVVHQFRTGSRGLTPSTSATTTDNAQTRREGFRPLLKWLLDWITASAPSDR